MSAMIDSLEIMQDKIEKDIIQPQKPLDLKENENLKENSSNIIEEVKNNEPLFDWEDIIGNGQLMKKVLKKGHDWTKPMTGDICILNIIGRLENSIVVEQYKNFEIFVGEGDVIQGLDLVIVLMNVEEIAEVKIHPRFAYGKFGNECIPPNSTIIYVVELLAVKCFDIINIDFLQRKKLSQKKRLRGNWWYDRHELYNALECYKKALAFLSMENLLDNGQFSDEDEMQKILDLSLTVRNNMVVTQMKLGSFDNALENVDYVLMHQPGNMKALHRKAKILIHKEQYIKAYDVYLELKKLYPSMKNLQNEISQLLSIITKNTKEEKNLYRKMLGMNVKTNLDKLIHKLPIEKNEHKNGINKKMMWGLIGGTALIFSIFVHKFIL